MRTNLISMV